MRDFPQYPSHDLSDPGQFYEANCNFHKSLIRKEL
jgi:hypothetical protein